MSKFKSARSFAAAVAVLPLIAAFSAPFAAHAQSIDYGSLESLFGEPVTTSATGSPQRSTDVPVDMTIISAEDIKRSGAHDLPTLLGRVSGVDVLNWASQSSDVGVRGYDQAMSPRLLVLVNGRQVYLDHYGYTAWSTIPVQLSEIRQIEVVKGPNAALFGFNAVSGVVNIITYNPKYDKVGADSVSVSSRDGREVSLAHTLRLSDKFAVRLSAGAAKADEWDNSSGLTSAEYRAHPSHSTVNADAVWSLSDKTSLRFETSLSEAQESGMVSNYDMAISKYGTTSAKVDLTSETDVGIVTATVYRNTLKSQSSVGTGFILANTITVANVQDLFKVGAHTFRVGVEARHNEMDTAPVAGGQVSYTVLAPSVMWAWAINDQVSTDVAIRNDQLSLKRTGTFPAGFPVADNAYWDKYIAEWSYNIGAVWRVTPNDTVRAIASRGIQLPTLVQFGGLQMPIPVMPGVTIAVMGNPDVEGADVDNLELSYDHSFKAAKLGVRLFSQKSTDLIGQPSSSEFYQYPTLTTYPAISWTNVGASDMTGYEVSLSGKLNNGFHWSADYTGTDVTEKPAAGSDPVGRLTAYGHTTPDYRANLALGWAGGKWTVDGFVHTTGAFELYAAPTYALTRIPAYTTLAANVSYDCGHGMAVSVSGQNLASSHQMQTTGLKVPGTVFVKLSKSW